jgi:glycosyltransferase involved in cell wall biosynthesis
LRVLHVSPYFAPAFRYGGPPRSILGLCQGLQHAGVQVEVITTAANGPSDLDATTAAGDRYEGIPVRYLPVAFPRRFFGARMRDALTEALARVDLCHIHGMWNVPEWSAARLARARGVPYVISPRGMLLPAAVRRGRWRKRVAFGLLESANLRHAALLHATSQDEADELARLGLGVRTAVVPNGVDLEAAAAAAPGFRRRLGIAEDAFVVVFVGRLHRIKRLDLLTQAFVDLRRTHARAHLVIAGPDEDGLLADVRRMTADHAGSVHTIGSVNDAEKWALLRSADVSVQCSDSESFGLAVVEAMAAARPVVVTRTCPWPEIVSRGCGFWVEQSAAGIAGGLRALADDPARATQMGLAGARFARECFGWDVIGQSVAELYADILARTGNQRVA